MTGRTYERLIVWQEADALCMWTYEVTRVFPASERYGLVQQMRRASHGVPSCIVEGNMRRTPKDKQHFFTQALGSLEELHYHYSTARRLKYVDDQIFEKACEHVGRVSYLLHKLRRSFDT